MASHNITVSSNIFSSLLDNDTLYFDGNTGHTSIHGIDYAIIAIYILISIGLGLYLSRRQSTALDYFLASRETKWPFVGLSLFASNISSSTLIGLAGDAYSTGISVYNYEWMAAFTLVIFATFLLPILLNLKLFTLPEFLERRYNAATRYYFSILTICLGIIVEMSGSMFAGSLVLRVMFPQLQPWQTFAILAVIAWIYTVSGGLAAVIYTDALQSAVLLLGSLIISVCTLVNAGGWHAVKSEVSPDTLSLIRPVNDDSVPWTGLIAGVPILELYYWCFNQIIAQRVLSSKDIKHARLGCILAGFLKLPVLFIMVLPGVMARITFPDLPRGDLVYPTLLFNVLPVGLLGLVISGFIAALMSQIDSTLNSTSTLVTIDFIKRHKSDLTEKQLMNIGRFVTFLCMIASICWTPVLDRFTSLFKYIQRILSYLIPPVVALYIGGLFWKGATACGATMALVLGNILGIVLFFIVEVMGWFSIHFLHVAPILFLVSLLVLVGVSLACSEKNTEDQLKLTWSSQKFLEDIQSLRDVPIRKNHIFHSTVLTVVIMIIVGCFW